MFKLACLIAGICLTTVLYVWASMSWISTERALDRDIGGWKVRAQVAANAPQMLEYVQKLRLGLEKRKMTEGFAALFVTKPENDMSLIYQAVLQVEERAQSLTTLPRTSDAYQQGLDDLRGTLRELSVPAKGFYWRQHLPTALRIFLIWGGAWLLLPIALAIGANLDDRWAYRKGG